MRGNTAILIVASLCVLTPARPSRATDLDTPVMWIAHLGGRPLDIYAASPSDQQLVATGLSMVKACIASYKNSEAARASAGAAAHFTVQRFISVQPDTQVLYLEDNRSFVVAVRGSQENADWILDLSQTTTLGLPVHVHVGFNAAANAVFADVQAQTSAARARGKQVWLTGHSLGGSVAQLLAFRLQSQMPIAGVHTFGSPAVGDITWAQRYDQVLRTVTHRWANEDDPIPCYPAIQQAWQQAGRQHVISAAGVDFDASMSTCEDAFPTVTRVCEPATWWGKAFSWLTGAMGVCAAIDPAAGIFNLIQNLGTNQFSQHRSEVYFDRLAEELPEPIVRGLVLQ